MTQQFYLTDESPFVATFGPPFNNSGYKNSSAASTSSTSSNSYFSSASHRGGAATQRTKPSSPSSSPTGSVSDNNNNPRTRLVNNVLHHPSKNQTHEQFEPPKQDPPPSPHYIQQPQHSRNKSIGGMSTSFEEAFSFVDSICSTFDDPNNNNTNSKNNTPSVHTAATTTTANPPPPVSVMRESSPTLSSMTPYVQQNQTPIQHQQPQPQHVHRHTHNPSWTADSILTPTSSSSSSASSFSQKDMMHRQQQLHYTAQLQQKAEDQARLQRKLGTNHALPKVTAAAAPFEKMIAPSSYLYGELLKDAGYRHALQAGTLWQSLCSQHVHFPALWYDGEEPARPPMGCSRKGVSHQHSMWKYFGRHRVQGDLKLNRLIGNRGSSGRLLLHIIVTSPTTGGAVADVCVGCFHPNARGVRLLVHHDEAIERCRDVWVGYRHRDTPTTQRKSRMEELLQHYNKGLVDTTPLGGAGSRQAKSLVLDNENLKAVLGARSPLFTVFVPEYELYDVLQRNVNARCPASIVLMRQYLREEAY